MVEQLTCSAHGDDWSCDKPLAGNGLCSSHYWQSRNKPSLTPVRAKVKNKWDGGRRWCGGCKQYLSPDDYHKSKGNRDGLANECKTCAMDRQLRINFNMTLEQYHEMLASQGGCCAICGVDSDPSGKKFAVDHDHACCPGTKTCGKCTRALLCERCNKSIGLFEDNPDLLRSAADYLESH